jgi:hypothetical protein
LPLETAALVRQTRRRLCRRHGSQQGVGTDGPAVHGRGQEAFDESDIKQRNFHEITYAAKTWDRARRVIVKAEVLPKGPNVRFVVTNLTDAPETIYGEQYTARGDMENRIKEQQLGLFADRTSCHGFLANQFRLLLAFAAYVLIEHLRRVGPAGTELAKAQVTTIRAKLFKIAARVTVSVRRIVFHLSSYCPYLQLFAVLVRLLTPI